MVTDRTTTAKPLRSQPQSSGGKGAIDNVGTHGRYGRTAKILDRYSRWLVLLSVYCCVVLLVFRTQDVVPENLALGRIVRTNISTPISFSLIDENEMNLSIRHERENSKFFYLYEPRSFKRSEDRIDTLFSKAQNGLKKYGEPNSQVVAQSLVNWAKTQGIAIGLRLAKTCVSHNDDTLMQDRVLKVLEHLYLDRGIVDDIQRYRAYDNVRRVEINNSLDSPDKPFDNEHVLEAGKGVSEYLLNEYLPARQTEFPLSVEDTAFLVDLVTAFAKPNIVFDRDATDEIQEKRIEFIRKNPPVRKYSKGAVLVESGTPITEKDLNILAHMEKIYTRTWPKRMAGTALYIGILFVIVFIYIRRFRSDIAFSTRNVLLVSLPVILAMILGRIVIEIVILPNALRFPEAGGYLFPSGMIGMLAVLLLDARLGVLLVTIGALAFSVATNMDFKIMFASIIGGYTAIAALTSLQERMEIILAGLKVAIVNVCVIFVVHIMSDPQTIPFTDSVICGLLNGIICIVFTIPALVLFEYSFKLITDVRLLELTGLDHPLLRRLEEDAPGSYQHSLNVTKLSEAAARAIGANYLLVRAGAYFHDAGKILKPKYFSENQVTLDDKNLHSKLSPYMSAMVIKNHVKAGIDLANQYRLPQRVIDFIPEHQGTTLITYFHRIALKRFEESQSTDPVREVDFRYPGPKPQSIETAIVMLADSVEATVTSRFTSTTVNEDELRLCVQKTIADKFNDEQFDECDLTLRDLHFLRESFIKTLLSRFHHRVAYPSAPQQSKTDAVAGGALR
jgi:putative nucleotidyltransferase with HDIG domain